MTTEPTPNEIEATAKWLYEFVMKRGDQVHDPSWAGCPNGMRTGWRERAAELAAAVLPVYRDRLLTELADKATQRGTQNVPEWLSSLRSGGEQG